MSQVWSVRGQGNSRNRYWEHWHARSELDEGRRKWLMRERKKTLVRDVMISYIGFVVGIDAKIFKLLFTI